MNCQFCGSLIDNLKRAEMFLYGKAYKLCPDCQRAYNKKFSMLAGKINESEAYFINLYESRALDADVALVVKHLTGRDNIKSKSEREEEKKL